MRLVDDDRVPAHGVEVLAVPALVLERVDRDDDPLVVGERVAAGRDLPLDPLDAERVQPDQRDREPGPQLQLELLEDLLRGDDQDAVAAAAADQLGEDEADLQGLAEADHVGEEDARAEVLQRELGGALLVGELVEEEAVRGGGEAALGLRERGAAQRRLQVEPGHREPGGVVADERRLLGPQQDRLRVFERGEEDGVLLADELRHAGGPDLVAVVFGGRAAADQPFGVPDDDPRPGRERRLVCLRS